MDDRLLALLLLGALGAGLWGASALYRAYIVRRAKTSGWNDSDPVLGLPRDGRPAVLGFTGDYCLPCKTQQRPALERLRRQLGGALYVQEVDALARPELAEQYGVLTVPTTVVLDARRRVVAINYGVASTEKLLAQVQPHLPARVVAPDALTRV